VAPRPPEPLKFTTLVFEHFGIGDEEKDLNIPDAVQRISIKPLKKLITSIPADTINARY
jgi:hypothetical protein